MISTGRIAAGLVAIATMLVMPITSHASPQSPTGKVVPGNGVEARGAMPNKVKYDPTWVFQCPMALCNRAENVFQSDDLVDYCYVSDGAQYWDLVYVKTPGKWYAGFIPENNLANISQTKPCEEDSPLALPQEPTDKAVPGNTIQVPHYGTFLNKASYDPTWVFQCPMTLCNRAENVFKSDDLVDYCYVSDGVQYWDLVYVRTPSKRYAGFVPENNLDNPGQYRPCETIN